MKCRLCGKDMGNDLDSLESHLWISHPEKYKLIWTKLLKSFMQKQEVKNDVS